MNLADFPSIYSIPAIITYALALVAMALWGMAIVRGYRKRIANSLLAAIIVLLPVGLWFVVDNDSNVTAFEDGIAAHFEDGYDYKLTSENAEQIRFAKGSDTVLHVMTEEGNVREVLFRGVDGFVVPFANDTNGEWAPAAAAGN